MKKLLHEEKLGKDAPRRIRGTTIKFFDVLGVLKPEIVTMYQLSKKEERHIKKVVQRVLEEHGHKLKLTFHTEQLPGGEQN